MTSISAERSRLANVGMTLRRREQWGARRSYTDARTVSEPATKQFVHITVTNPGNYNSFDAHARAIEAIGISRFPNTGISYNRLFMAGTRNVYEAQPVGRRGAHTVNDYRRSTCSLSGCPSRGTSLSAPSWNLNYNARAYAYASNVGFSVPDHVIDDMARSMAADRLAGFVTRNATIHGHRCVSSKSCPGDRMWDRMHDLERRVEHYLSNGPNGDSMSWNEDLTPGTPGNDITNLAHETLPPKWGRYAADLLGYAAAGASLVLREEVLLERIARTDNVMKAPKRYRHQDTNPHWMWERYEVEQWDMLDELLEIVRPLADRIEALEAAVQGSDAGAIKALITERHDQADQQRQVIAGTMTEKLDAIVEATQGSDPAEAKLAAILEILGVEQTD